MQRNRPVRGPAINILIALAPWRARIYPGDGSRRRATAPCVMERVAVHRDPPLVPCMVGSPYYGPAHGFACLVKTKKIRRHCRVTDVKPLRHDDRAPQAHAADHVELSYRTSGGALRAGVSAQPGGAVSGELTAGASDERRSADLNTRSLTGTIFHASGAAWASAVVRFRLLRRFVAPTASHRPIGSRSPARRTAPFSTALAVPDDGTAAYEITLPTAPTVVYLAAGSAIDLSVLLASSSASVEPSALVSEARLRTRLMRRSRLRSRRSSVLRARQSTRRDLPDAPNGEPDAALLARRARVARVHQALPGATPTQIGSDSSTPAPSPPRSSPAALCAAAGQQQPGCARHAEQNWRPALGNDPAFATTIAAALGNRLRFDARRRV